MAEATETTDELTDEQRERGTKLSNAEIIARRSADIDASAATNDEHLKVFVLPPGPKPTEANGYDHAANKAATRQYAISQGLRPSQDDVRLVSIKQHKNKKSWVLTYGVKVVPAEFADYPLPATAEVITEAIAEDDGHVPTNTDGAGHSGDTRTEPTA